MNIWEFYGPDFAQEIANFGYQSPSAKLGAYIQPEYIRAINTAKNVPEASATDGIFDTRGLMLSPKSDETVDEMLNKVMPLDVDYTPNKEVIPQNSYFIGLVDRAKNPFDISILQHELAHIGQYKNTGRSYRSSDEARQRVRDLMYNTDPEEAAKDIKWLIDKNISPASDLFADIAKEAMIEDFRANKMLEQMGYTAGDTPDLGLINFEREKRGADPLSIWEPLPLTGWMY